MSFRKILAFAAVAIMVATCFAAVSNADASKESVADDFQIDESNSDIYKNDDGFMYSVNDENARVMGIWRPATKMIIPDTITNPRTGHYSRVTIISFSPGDTEKAKSIVSEIEIGKNIRLIGVPTANSAAHAYGFDGFYKIKDITFKGDVDSCRLTENSLAFDLNSTPETKHTIHSKDNWVHDACLEYPSIIGLQSSQEVDHSLFRFDSKIEKDKGSAFTPLAVVAIIALVLLAVWCIKTRMKH